MNGPTFSQKFRGKSHHQCCSQRGFCFRFQLDPDWGVHFNPRRQIGLCHECLVPRIRTGANVLKIQRVKDLQAVGTQGTGEGKLSYGCLSKIDRHAIGGRPLRAHTLAQLWLSCARVRMTPTHESGSFKLSLPRWWRAKEKTAVCHY